MQQRRQQNFLSSVLWSDESTFTNNEMWNRRNLHVWAHVNPFPRRPTGHQYRWSVNVWAGIIGLQIVGPIFLPPRLNSGNYLEFIEDHLVDIMDSLYQLVRSLVVKERGFNKTAQLHTARLSLEID